MQFVNLHENQRIGVISKYKIRFIAHAKYM